LIMQNSFLIADDSAFGHVGADSSCGEIVPKRRRGYMLLRMAGCVNTYLALLEIL
jgi:hypothetical protein